MKFQTNIVLSESAADWLDTQALAIRKRTRVYVSRSALLRALVHGLADSGLDLSRCASEFAIARAFSIILRTYFKLPPTPELPMYTTEGMAIFLPAAPDRDHQAFRRRMPGG